MKVGILNTSILTTDGVSVLKTISLDHAKKLVSGGDIDSAVGHQATAEFLTELLGIEVPQNRQQFQQQPGQSALVFKLKGRIPEGTILGRREIEEIGYEFKILYVLLPNEHLADVDEQIFCF